MARLRPTTIRRRDGVAILGFLLAGGAPLAAPVGSEIVTCATLQQVRVSAGEPWRCQISLERNQSYLAEVARQTRDVTLELIGPDARRVLRSIRRRTGRVRKSCSMFRRRAEVTRWYSMSPTMALHRGRSS